MDACPSVLFNLFEKKAAKMRHLGFAEHVAPAQQRHLRQDI